jgi:hypothetical protein
MDIGKSLSKVEITTDGVADVLSLGAKVVEGTADIISKFNGNKDSENNEAASLPDKLHKIGTIIGAIAATTSAIVTIVGSIQQIRGAFD